MMQKIFFILSVSVLISGINLVISDNQLVVAAGSETYSLPSKPAIIVKAEKAIKKGQFADAYKVLSENEQQHSNNADLYNLMGYSARKLELFDDSMAHYQKALSIDPKHKGALEYLGELYLTLDQPDNAKVILGKLKSICFLGCEEKTELSDAIKKWEATNK